MQLLQGKEIFHYVEFLSFENVDGNPYRNTNRFGICIEAIMPKSLLWNTDGIKTTSDWAYHFYLPEHLVKRRRPKSWNRLKG